MSCQAFRRASTHWPAGAFACWPSGVEGPTPNPTSTPHPAPPRCGPPLIEDDLTLIGLVGLMDPPRPEVPAALAAAHAAGIRTVMVTGDHPITALAIAARLGLGDGHVLTGVDLQQMDDAALARAARDLAICARVAPQQKVDIVRALQADGEVVGMTGDGSNDAPGPATRRHRRRDGPARHGGRERGRCDRPRRR